MNNSKRPNFPANPHRRGRGIPSTPHLQWKFEDNKTTFVAGDGTSLSRGNRGVELSSRKLAAGIWKLSFKEISGCSRPKDHLSLEAGVGLGQKKCMFSHYCSSRDCSGQRKSHLRSPLYISKPKNLVVHKLESSLPYTKAILERTTKWENECSKASDNVYYVCSHLKLPKNQRVTARPTVSTLQADLVQERLRVRKLEAKRLSFKKKIRHFLRKLEEERILWKIRERKKIDTTRNRLRHELDKESISCHRMEILNTILVNQLIEAKLSAQKIMKELEEEKKSRELLEEVCAELAKQIGEQRAENERSQRKFMKVREELEEEKKMLQMAEVWREERVQMKLIDAKLALDEKYCQMNKLITDLEAFLKSKGATLDVMELRKAEMILKAVESISIQDFEKFSYSAPKSDDIFSILREIQEWERYEREIKPSIDHSNAHNDSRIHTRSPDVNNKYPVDRHSDCLSRYNSSVEEDAGSCGTSDRGFGDSLRRCNDAANGVHQGNNVWRNRREWKDKAGLYSSPNAEITEVISPEHLKLVPSSVGDVRLSNGTISNVVTTSPHGRSDEGEPRRCGKWIAPHLENPHIMREMKGCIEWPQSIQKKKARFFESRIQSHKPKLGHVLSASNRRLE